MRTDGELDKMLTEEMAKEPLRKAFYWGKPALRAMRRAYELGRADQKASSAKRHRKNKD